METSSIQRQTINELGDDDIALITSVFNERKYVILFCFLSALLIALAYIGHVKPQYVAVAEIEVDKKSPMVASPLLALSGGGGVDMIAIRTQSEIMQSPAVLRQLIEREKLFKRGDFNFAPDKQSFYDLSLKQQETIINLVKKRISVKPVLATTLMHVEYRSIDPQLAADVANALVDLYIDFQKTEKKKTAKELVEWLSDKLKEVSDQIEQTQSSLFKALQNSQNMGLAVHDERLIKQQQLRKEISILQAEYSRVQSSLVELEKLQKTRSKKILQNTLVADNPNLAGLMASLSALEQEKISLSTRYGAKHPSMKSIGKQIANIKIKISHETLATMSLIRNANDIRARQIETIETELNALKKSFKNTIQEDMDIKTIRTDLETLRDVYKNFFTAYRQAIQNEALQKSDVHVITAATPPVYPVFPKIALILGIAAITGLFMGLSIALVLEKLQNMFQNIGQIEKYFGLPVYAILPKVKMGRHQNPAEFIYAYPASWLAELLRSLTATIRFRKSKSSHSFGQVLTVTSTTTGEGKTVTALWLATIAAQNGRRVIVLDADLRNPSLHMHYDISDLPGLSDYLTERMPLDHAVYTDHPSNVHLMCSKAMATHAQTLLTSDRMEALVRRLRDEYDFVILDAPAMSSYCDAQILAQLSDKVLYVLEWKKTRRDTFARGIKKLLDIDCHDIAVIVNKAKKKNPLKNVS